jgi:hypothetical protein
MRYSWRYIHWASRIAILVVLAALLWWQARYALTIVHNPMYGWPMPFNNVWCEGFHHAWRPQILLLDIAVWFVLAASTGYVLDVWRRKPNKRQVTLRTLFALQSVAAVVLALGCVEGYLRAHPNNDSIFPEYARWEFGAVSLWFDIGLFTDPLRSSPILRATIVFAVACSVYTAGHFLFSTIRLVGDSLKMRSGRSLPVLAAPSPTPDVAGSNCRTSNTQREPILARIIIIVLAIAVFVLAAGTLFPPAIR